MLRTFLQILPVFIYKRIALKHCERIPLPGGDLWVQPAHDILVALPTPPATEE